MRLALFCIGTNQMDLDALAEAGVPAFNAPYSNTRSVVELVMAEIIALARRLGDRNTQMHNGVWRKSAIGSHEIRGRRLGIIGYGNIGQQLSVVAEAMGMQVFFSMTSLMFYLWATLTSVIPWKSCLVASRRCLFMSMDAPATPILSGIANSP
ncbi:D-3-phosphoglycerate dehydrogenase [Cutibacterium acnes JCM 18909]|nr:D-3-phosphoglycerate dehydrogenase [Cutibacterium acnes JCM 18909]